MTCLPSKIFGVTSFVLTALYTTFATIVLIACSNSEPAGLNGNDGSTIDYLPLDDTEYPYAGIPRIVIETKNHREIKDRETEIPAKLQIWGEKAPESEILDLTIRGRGNTSWTIMPKKSYKIEFVNKQNILGMSKDRDWALIANYADKSLIKNYLMYHLSANLDAYYAPRCEFAELYINKEYLGVYLLTETIKIANNRINISKDRDSYIVEFDERYRKGEQVFFSKIIRNNSVGKPFHIHEPKDATKEQISTIEDHITKFEIFLKQINSKINNHIEQWIDVDEYIKHYWVQEFSKNPDADFYSSVYFSWEKNNLIKFGPVWDFDLAFGNHSDETRNTPENWFIKKAYWNIYMFKDSTMRIKHRAYWEKNLNIFLSSLNTVDSLSKALQAAAGNNFKKWDVLGRKKNYHRTTYSSYEEAIEDLKTWIHNRITWINKELLI